MFRIDKEKGAAGTVACPGCTWLLRSLMNYADCFYDWQRTSVNSIPVVLAILLFLLALVTVLALILITVLIVVLVLGTVLIVVLIVIHGNILRMISSRLSRDSRLPQMSGFILWTEQEAA